MVESAYIHIPFCKNKCNYCSFVSFPILERKGAYLHALKEQIAGEYKGENLSTLYFGGGTPSLLTVKEISTILDFFNLDDNAEITLEMNPETVNSQYLQSLALTRVNRLSIGSQTFDDGILKRIGRRHKSTDVIRVVDEARKAGFKNLSLDFIYGLPGQTLESFISDLEQASKLGVDHISLYGLKIEDGCFFALHPPEDIAGEELQAQMYLKAIKTLSGLGFEHYEISNFAHSGKFSRHNTNYWRNQEYYGFGLAAHGYVDGVRYSNPENLDIYLENPLARASSQILSAQEKLEEEIFLGLRLSEGISVNNINRKFGIDFERKYKEVLSKYMLTEYMQKNNGFYRLSDAGILVSNIILAEFIE